MLKYEGILKDVKHGDIFITKCGYFVQFIENIDDGGFYFTNSGNALNYSGNVLNYSIDGKHLKGNHYIADNKFDIVSKLQMTERELEVFNLLDVCDLAKHPITEDCYENIREIIAFFEKKKEECVYYIIYKSQDGQYVEDVSKEDLEAHLNDKDWYGEGLKILNKIPENGIEKMPYNSLIIIKGDIIVPKITKEYKLD